MILLLSSPADNLVRNHQVSCPSHVVQPHVPHNTSRWSENPRTPLYNLRILSTSQEPLRTPITRTPPSNPIVLITSPKPLATPQTLRPCYHPPVSQPLLNPLKTPASGTPQACPVRHRLTPEPHRATSDP